MSEILNIKSDSTLFRTQNAISSEIDGEVVLLSVKNSEYLCLNGVGSKIWNYLESPHTFSEVVDYLLSKYDVEHQKCESDTKEYIFVMINVGMINIQ